MGKLKNVLFGCLGGLFFFALLFVAFLFMMLPAAAHASSAELVGLAAILAGGTFLYCLLPERKE